jgi:hypothetical protein
MGVPADGVAVSLMPLSEEAACQMVLVVFDPKYRTPLFDDIGSAHE